MECDRQYVQERQKKISGQVSQLKTKGSTFYERKDEILDNVKLNVKKNKIKDKRQKTMVHFKRE